MSGQDVGDQDDWLSFRRAIAEIAALPSDAIDPGAPPFATEQFDSLATSEVLVFLSEAYGYDAMGDAAAATSSFSWGDLHRAATAARARRYG